MKTVLLCGGEGTRLRPYTYNIPKPMLPLGRKPILEFVINNLKRNGLEDIVITLGYLKEQIIDYFGDGSKFGVKIEYIIEDKKMNTAGSLFPILNKLDDTFLVGMGDHVTNINLKKMIDYHKSKGNIATIGLKRQGMPFEYGVVQLDENNNVREFKEKPIIENLINSAIYVFEPEIRKYIAPGRDFAKDVFPEIMRENKKISGYIFDDFWLDIGRINDYENVNQVISIVDIVKSNGYV